MNILLVEDEDAIAEIVQAILHRPGHKVTVLADGDEALRLYRHRECRYDLVLTDRWHTGIDGIELAAAIRKLNPEQAIAFFTSPGDYVVEQKFAAYGVSDLPRLLKSSTPEQLLQFVESVAQKRTTQLPNP